MFRPRQRRVARTSGAPDACAHLASAPATDDELQATRRHVTSHHEPTGRPVARSTEPGESWRWCYVDLELKA